MSVGVINNAEIEKVNAFLVGRGLSFEYVPLYDGWLLAVPSLRHREFDVVIHSGSYGHEMALLESMGCISESPIGDCVEGWLTAETAIERIKEHYLKGPYLKENSK